jgi:hypothetical protein
MGTSRDYIPPAANAWRPDKRQLDKIPNIGSVPKPQMRGLLGSYIKGKGNGGPATMAGSGGGGVAVSQAGSKTAARIGGFFSGISAEGLNATLEKIGFSHLIGKNSSEILQELLDFLVGTGATGDDEDARRALVELWSQILGEAQTYEEVDDVLSTICDESSLSNILISFYGYYIFEQFWRVDYKIISDRVGDEKAEHMMHEMKTFIKEELRDKVCSMGKAITEIDWQGKEGQEICRQVMEKTLYVFCPEEE